MLCRRWRTYLQPGVMHASTVPFSEWEQAVVKEVRRQTHLNDMICSIAAWGRA